jgi:AcrR family transcriptional regulator
MKERSRPSSKSSAARKSNTDGNRSRKEPIVRSRVVPVIDKHQQILQGALRTFLEYGYTGSSMDLVAQQSNVSKQTIYSHFRDKNGLFHALAEYLLSDTLPLQSDSDLLSLEPAAFLTVLAKLYFARMDRWEYQNFFRLVIAESARFPELGQLYVRKVQDPGNQLLIEYMKAHSELGFSDPESAARIFRGALASFVISEEILQGKLVTPLARERYVKSLVGLFLNSK